MSHSLQILRQPIVLRLHHRITNGHQRLFQDGPIQGDVDGLSDVCIDLSRGLRTPSVPKRSRPIESAVHRHPRPRPLS